MFRKSRLSVFALGAFFLFVWTLIASAHCFDAWAEHDEINASAAHYAHTAPFVCRDDEIEVYAIGQPSKLGKHKSNASYTTDRTTAKSENRGDQVQPPVLVALSSSLVPYRSVAVYQLNLVYRI